MVLPCLYIYIYIFFLVASGSIYYTIWVFQCTLSDENRRCKQSLRAQYLIVPHAYVHLWRLLGICHLNLKQLNIVWVKGRHHLWWRLNIMTPSFFFKWRFTLSSSSYFKWNDDLSSQRVTFPSSSSSPSDWNVISHQYS